MEQKEEKLRYQKEEKSRKAVEKERDTVRGGMEKLETGSPPHLGLC